MLTSVQTYINLQILTVVNVHWLMGHYLFGYWVGFCSRQSHFNVLLT